VDLEVELKTELKGMRMRCCALLWLLVLQVVWIVGCGEPAPRPGVDRYIAFRHQFFVDTARGKKTDWGPFRFVYPFREGLACVMTPDERWGYISERGEMVIPAKFHIAFPFVNGVAVAAIEEGKFGLIGTKGEWIVEPSFELLMVSDGMKLSTDDLVVARRDGKYGYINRRGEVVIPFQFARAVAFSEGLAAVAPTDPSSWGFVDKDGKLVIEPSFTGFFSFANGVAPVRKDGKWGMIDAKGAAVIPFKYTGVHPLESGRTFVTEGEANSSVTFMVDGEGDRVGSQVFDRASGFSEGLADVREVGAGRKQGYIDPDGRYVIEPKYDKALAFEGGAARVELDDEHGLIDRTGAWLWRERRAAKK